MRTRPGILPWLAKVNWYALIAAVPMLSIALGVYTLICVSRSGTLTEVAVSATAISLSVYAFVEICNATRKEKEE